MIQNNFSVFCSQFDAVAFKKNVSADFLLGLWRWDKPEVWPEPGGCTADVTGCGGEVQNTACPVSISRHIDSLGIDIGRFMNIAVRALIKSLNTDDVVSSLEGNWIYPDGAKVAE